jgi:hypothetical protein
LTITYGYSIVLYTTGYGSGSNTVGITLYSVIYGGDGHTEVTVLGFIGLIFV